MTVAHSPGHSPLQTFHFHFKVLLNHEECIQLCSVTELYHHNTPLHVAARMGKAQAVKVGVHLYLSRINTKIAKCQIITIFSNIQYVQSYKFIMTGELIVSRYVHNRINNN